MFPAVQEEKEEIKVKRNTKKMAAKALRQVSFVSRLKFLSRVAAHPGPLHFTPSWAFARRMSDMPLPPKKKLSSRLGPVTWTSLALIVAAGTGLVYYFQTERDKAKAKLPTLDARQIGKPKLGGPFTLIDQNGQTRSDTDFRGRFMLIYFGFTFCPDICPEELSKLVSVIDSIDAIPQFVNKVQPIFISVDPKRDSVQQVRDYLRDFSPKIVGLTGAKEDIAKAARAFRVYFSAAQMDDSDPNSADYLVDHSIFFYLMDPQGQFLDYYGQNKTADEIVKSIRNYLSTWKETEPSEPPVPQPTPSTSTPTTQA